MTKLQRSATIAGLVVVAALATVPTHPPAPRPASDPPAYVGAAALAVGLFGLVARRRG